MQAWRNANDDITISCLDWFVCCIVWLVTDESCLSNKSSYFNIIPQSKFPKWGQLNGGDKLGKMAENCMKITKSTFWGQNSGGKANFLGSGGSHPNPTTRRNPVTTTIYWLQLSFKSDLKPWFQAAIIVFIMHIHFLLIFVYLLHFYVPLFLENVSVFS